MGLIVLDRAVHKGDVGFSLPQVTEVGTRAKSGESSTEQNRLLRALP